VLRHPPINFKNERAEAGEINIPPPIQPISKPFYQVISNLKNQYRFDKKSVLRQTHSKDELHCNYRKNLPLL